MKPHLVLVHSFPTNSNILSGLIEFLEQYFTVHFIDLPGFTKQIPPLKKILDELKDTKKIIDIELKQTGIARQVIEKCKRYDILDRVVFTAMYKDIVNEIYHILPKQAVIFGYPRDRGKNLANRKWTKPFVDIFILYYKLM